MRLGRILFPPSYHPTVPTTACPSPFGQTFPAFLGHRLHTAGRLVERISSWQPQTLQMI